MLTKESTFKEAFDLGYSSAQLLIILETFRLDLDSSKLDDVEFTPEQMREILLGLVDKLDVTPYADKKYNHIQMMYLRLGIKEGLDIQLYSSEEFNAEKMGEIYSYLLQKKNDGIQSVLESEIQQDPNYNLYDDMFNLDRGKKLTQEEVAKIKKEEKKNDL